MTDAADPSHALSLHRLRTTGRRLRKGFTLLLALDIGVIALITALFVGAEAAQHLLNLRSVGADLVCGGAKCIHAPTDMVTFNSALASGQAFWYGLVIVLRGLPPVFILWRLRALCGLYENGVVFSRANVRHVEWIGAWTVFWSGMPTLAHLLLSLAGADMHSHFKHWTDPGQIILGLFGVGVLLSAQVMQVGRHIDEDRSQFV